jgi:hypothetical protein
VVGDPYPSPVSAQHDVRWLGNEEISVHDNETDTGRVPRAVRYRIENGTATLIDSQTDPQVPFSVCCGSARYSADYSLLVSWGGTNKVREYDTTGARTFALDFADNAFTYRAIAVDEELSVDRLRDGMRAQHPNAHLPRRVAQP